jgi:carboxyl-terminal processing protease
VLATREETRAAQLPRDREADLRRSLRNDTQEETRAPIPPPPLNLPAGLVERVVRQPAEGAPAFDPTKPETDHQLQQALMLLRGMASAPRGGQR